MTAEYALSAASDTNFLRTHALTGQDVSAKRRELAAYYNATSDQYESLFELIADPAGYYQKSIPLRHPLIFYYGHTATFFINKLLLTGLIKKRLNPKIESMFAVGVDEMSWDDLDETNYDWPSIEEVKSYRQQVRKLVNQLIAEAPLELPINWQNPWWAIIMGIEHEQIHLETSSVLIRQQNLSYLQKQPAWQPWGKTAAAPTNRFIPVAAGSVTLGKTFDDAFYGWDNEYGQHHAEVAEFKASQFLVSNAEFLEFVDAGGYQADQFWSEEGLNWRRFAGAFCPTFWIKQQDHWQLRLLAHVIAMPWDWPVDVNYHEAKAFCNWKASTSGQTVRLPTEDEWYRLAHVAGVDELDSGAASANLHLDYAASSCPVNTFAQGEFYDVVGNVWQWTETPIYPFEGFKVHPIYDDFTTPTYDGQHNIIKGGSWISSGNETRLASRYAFRRHFFQHAGFRYVVSDAPVEFVDSHYESDKMLSEYAEFHYGERYFNIPNFQQTIAQLCIDLMQGRPTSKALDLGCAVGRASFELAREFDAVTGVDFSARLINLGVQLAQRGVIRYTLTDEGELVHYREQRLADLGLTEVADKVEFMQGDACNLKAMFNDYDLVLAANLLDRLYEPGLFLKSIHTHLKVGGLLVLASPYTWLEDFTDKANWVGGFKKDGESFTTLDGLKAHLEAHFNLIQTPGTIPFVIRETSHKFQHSLSEVTVWERKA